MFYESDEASDHDSSNNRKYLAILDSINSDSEDLEKLADETTKYLGLSASRLIKIFNYILTI
jgi:hypothetical protein